MHRIVESVKLLILLLALVIAGCSSDNLFDAEKTFDAGTDSGTDAGTDAGSTTGTDAGSTTGTDSGTDAGSTTGTDSGIDAGSTTGTDSGTDAGSTTGTDSGTDAGSTTGVDAGSTTGTDAGTGFVSNSGPGTVGAANCPAWTSTVSSISIAGLYELDIDGAAEDVIYFEISDSGVLSIYDYQQDEFDQGGNCYNVLAGVGVLYPLGNNEYSTSIYVNPNENCSTSTDRSIFSLSETALTETYVDTEDEDMDGDTTDLVADVAPVVTGLSTESFNSCE